jgi:hypothetical protein
MGLGKLDIEITNLLFEHLGGMSEFLHGHGLDAVIDSGASGVDSDFHYSPLPIPGSD